MPGSGWDASRAASPRCRSVSPRTSRLNPRTGLISAAPTSRTTRFEPVAWLSSVREENRNSISPREMPAQRGVGQIVGRRRPDLSEQLPHQAAPKGPGHRLPEVVAVGPPGVEVEAAVVRVGELVVVELVVVPLPGKLEVVAPGPEGNVRPLALGDPFSEPPGNELDYHQLTGPGPEPLGRVAIGTGLLPGPTGVGDAGTRVSLGRLSDAHSSWRAWPEADSGRASEGCGGQHKGAGPAGVEDRSGLPASLAAERPTRGGHRTAL